MFADTATSASRTWNRTRSACQSSYVRRTVTMRSYFRYNSNLANQCSLSYGYSLTVTFCNFCIFIRPPDIVCRRTYIVPRILLSSFFAAQSPSSLNGTQPKPAMLGSNCDLKTLVENLEYIPSPYEPGPSNSTASFAHPMLILLSTSLPGFADGDQQQNSTTFCQTADGKSR